MPTLADLLADLNDRLDDADSSAGIGRDKKVRYINHGLRAMYPKIYESVRDSSLVVVDDEYEYALPAAFDHATITRVQLESASGSNRYGHLYEYEIHPTLTDKVLELDHTVLPVEAGARFRIFAVKPLTELSLDADVYTGPPNTQEIPVWYALGLALGRGIEPRSDHTRYSSTAAQNGVDLDELMTASQFAFAQFELLLERHQMPLPTQTG